MQLLEHDRAIPCPLNSNLLNILLLGKGGEWAGEERGARGLGHGPSNFFKPGQARPVDRSTGLKDGPNSGLRPNFSGPGGPAWPVGDPYFHLIFIHLHTKVVYFPDFILP